ncbi:MAG TPA: hypothetical protein VFM44_12305 [Gemmatimonadota bacterium]|nr:hypothetical protein [Gemmatimonadota bacterium]
MNVRVDENRFLSVPCEPEERVVFDRQEKKYHLLRESAARLWDEIGEGGAFDLATVTSEAEDPLAQLVDAGLVSIEPDQTAPRGITRRVWLTRTGKASAAAIVLPLVATIATPRFVLGQADVSIVDLNEEPTAVVEETTEELEKLTATERRRLKREQRKREQGEGTTPTYEQPIVGTPTTPQDTTSSLSGYFRRRRED